MQKSGKVLLSTAAVVTAVLIGTWAVHRARHPIVLTGVVTIQDNDPGKQLTIPSVEITAENGVAETPTTSDTSGFFALHLRKWVRRGYPVTLNFRHPNYQPLDLTDSADARLRVIRMVPIPRKLESTPAVAIGNVRVRYSIKGTRAVDVGSAAKMFEVRNIGNVPCKRQPPCSPDGRWKAAFSSITLDAGLGNEFQNIRVSCIAGPCPFTRIEAGDFIHPSQVITAGARNWSDTATFLVEAEVIHMMQSVNDHVSYPVIFGSALDFTLPAGAEGVSFEADVGGQTVIFPLGPALRLGWAHCNTTSGGQQTIYRCELEPGYRFE